LTTKFQQHINTITVSSTTAITAQTDVVLETTTKTPQTLPIFITHFTIDKGQAIGNYLVVVQRNIYHTILRVVVGATTMPLDHP